MATTSIAVGTMKVAQISKAGGGFEIVEREIPNPGVGQVRIKVEACGICHSDVLTKDGLWPGIQFPRVPGHEVAGLIDEVGPGVSTWKKGQRVGVGWHGGHDGTCLACRRGDYRNCSSVQVPGISYDGGYQQYMLAPIDALAAIPEGMRAVEALRCSALESPPSIRCGTAARCLATWWRCRIECRITVRLLADLRRACQIAPGLPGGRTVAAARSVCVPAGKPRCRRQRQIPSGK